MLGIIWLFMGGLLGLLANFFMPGKAKRIPVLTIVIGVIGAIAGGAFGVFAGLGTIQQFNLGLVLAALFGAYFVLASFRFATR